MYIAEFFDWLEFAHWHPFPADIIDRQAAQQLAMLGNINRDPATPAFEPGRFYIMRDPFAPKPQPRPARQTLTIAERMRSAIRSGG